jgi:hypothetical protein
MNLNVYQAECQRTKSPQFFGHKVARSVFIARALAAVEALRKLDEVKKALFYGKSFDGLVTDNEVELSCYALQLHNLHMTPQGGMDIIHCIIGKATESGELLEALLKSVDHDGQQFDATNFVEEVGDGFWYDGIGLEAVRATFADAASINNAKLRRRFPDKFTESAAINRDVDAERSVLDEGMAATETAHGASRNGETLR